MNELQERSLSVVRHACLVFAILTATLVTPVLAQDAGAGQVADSAVGRVGERQTRADGETIGIEPLSRVASRVQNRVQSRIRNRIDRFYNPQANATSPFVVAGEQARTAGRQRQR